MVESTDRPFDISKVTKEDFLVEGLENIQAAYADFPGKMYAGRLPADNGGNREGMTMFWLFEPDEQQVENTMVTWLNGGPGCSSFNCGVMMEHSPVTQPLRPAGFCCLKPTPDLSYNNNTWTKATTMLYVEHPWGTGFSYGRPEPQTEYEASGDLYAFMQNFFKVFDHLADYKYFVFGESYAGMFVPSILRYFHHKNLALADTSEESSSSSNGDIKIKISGGAIGNGWMDPAIQGPATIDYSWWHGMIDKPTRDNLLDIWNRCASGDKKDSFVEGAPFHPFNVQDDCGMMWGILQASGHPNEYDITTFDANVDQVTFTSEAFYNMPEVKKALHAPDDHFWHGCQWGEGRRRHLMEKHRQLYMNEDKPLSMAPYVSELLDAEIPLLVYNGDRDMTTNMVGTEVVLNERLEWKGKDHWLDAPRGLWKTNDYPAGWAKEYGNLTFAIVYNSGHMVPYNQPEPAYDLLVRFLTQKSLIDLELPQVRASKPVEPKPLPWLHLYPEGKQAYDASFGRLKSINEDSSSSFTAASIEPNMSIQSSPFGGATSSATSMGLLIAFVAGIGVALLAVLFLQRRERRQKKEGYTAVPNVALESSSA